VAFQQAACGCSGDAHFLGDLAQGKAFLVHLREPFAIHNGRRPAADAPFSRAFSSPALVRSESRMRSC
jgi:hypothetical protein